MTKGVTLPEIMDYVESNKCTPQEAFEHFRSLGRIADPEPKEPEEIPPYTVEFTPLAAAFADAKWSRGGVEERVRGELAELAQNGCYLPDLFFHTVWMPGADHETEALIITPKDGEPLVMLIDTASSEEVGEAHGKKIVMPFVDTEKE